MCFPVELTVARFRVLFRLGMKTITIIDFDTLDYLIRGETPDKIPENLLDREVNRYYYRPDLGHAILYV